MKITIDVPVNTLGVSVTVIYGDAAGVLMDTKMLGKNEIKKDDVKDRVCSGLCGCGCHD